MTTTALMRYHKQQQQQRQQHHQQPHHSSTTLASSDLANSSESNTIECDTGRPLSGPNTPPGGECQSSTSCINPSLSLRNGYVSNSLHNAFLIGETNNENYVAPTDNSDRNHYQNLQAIPEAYHNLNNASNYNNNHIEVPQGDSVSVPVQSTSQKSLTGYGLDYPYNHQLWNFPGAHTAAQSAVLVARTQAVEAIQHKENRDSTTEHLTPLSSSYCIENRANETSISTVSDTEKPSLTTLNVPTEKNVSELAKKLLAVGASALRNGQKPSVAQTRRTTFTATTKIVQTTSITKVLSEDTSIPQDPIESSEINRNQTEPNYASSSIPNIIISIDEKKHSTSTSPTEQKQTTAFTSCRKSNVLSESPLTSSASTSKIASSATSLKSISASSSSSSTPSISETTPNLNPPEFSHSTLSLPTVYPGSNVSFPETASPSTPKTERSKRCQNEMKHEKYLLRDTFAIRNNKPNSLKESLKVNLENLSLAGHTLQEIKNSTVTDDATHTKSLVSGALVSVDNSNNYNNSSNLTSNYLYSSHREHNISQNGSLNTQSHFHRYVNQVHFSLHGRI